MVLFHTKVYREVPLTILSVIGLSSMMIGLYILTGNFRPSVVPGTIAGSAASLLNYLLHVMTVQLSIKYGPPGNLSLLLASKIFRTFLMGFMAFVILLLPELHVAAGITSMFFASIRPMILKTGKSLS